MSMHPSAWRKIETSEGWCVVNIEQGVKLYSTQTYLPEGKALHFSAGIRLANGGNVLWGRMHKDESEAMNALMLFLNSGALELPIEFNMENAYGYNLLGSTPEKPTIWAR